MTQTNQLSSNRIHFSQRDLNTPRSRVSRTTDGSKLRTFYSSINDQVKQNQLQWMFNRRKQQLTKTTQQNIQIYLRIKSQKSFVAKNIQKRGPNFMFKPRLSRVQTALDKENIQVHNQLHKRDKQINKLLINTQLLIGDYSKASNLPSARRFFRA